VRNADRGHLDDLALDQLDPIVGREHAGVDHALVLVHGEASRARENRHRFTSSRR